MIRWCIKVHSNVVKSTMLDVLKNEDIDIVVGSRYAPGGDISGWDANSKIHRALPDVLWLINNALHSGIYLRTTPMERDDYN